VERHEGVSLVLFIWNPGLLSFFKMRIIIGAAILIILAVAIAIAIFSIVKATYKSWKLWTTYATIRDVLPTYSFSLVFVVVFMPFIILRCRWSEDTFEIVYYFTCLDSTFLFSPFPLETVHSTCILDFESRMSHWKRCRSNIYPRIHDHYTTREFWICFWWSSQVHHARAVLGLVFKITTMSSRQPEQN